MSLCALGTSTRGLAEHLCRTKHRDETESYATFISTKVRSSCCGAFDIQVFSSSKMRSDIS